MTEKDVSYYVSLFKFYITCASLEPFFLFLINLLILLFNFKNKILLFYKKANLIDKIVILYEVLKKKIF
jgi:hypothetical protein